jgi:ferredoxin-NADP reductase
MTEPLLERSSALRQVRRVAKVLTTPLHPDDYLSILNPLWSARELRGRVERVVPETENAATVVITPGWGWVFDHQPGQYIGIGVEIEGKFHWRSYSLSSPPQREGRSISISVKAMPEGFLSEHLVRGLAPGTIVRLAAPQGDFVLPDPPPESMLFLVGGSGITPVMSMLRTLDRRGTMPDVDLVYSARREADMMFRDELNELAAGHQDLRLHERFTDLDGVFALDELDGVCPDWADRQTWACGPAPMLDAIVEHYEKAGLRDNLHLERFSLDLSGGDASGGMVTFGSTGKTVEVDGATTLLEAGEAAGINLLFGCRMGICHTCTVPLTSGMVRDMRTGEEHDKQNETIQTCISVAAGDCVLGI